MHTGTRGKGKALLAALLAFITLSTRAYSSCLEKVKKIITSEVKKTFVFVGGAYRIKTELSHPTSFRIHAVFSGCNPDGVKRWLETWLPRKAYPPNTVVEENGRIYLLTAYEKDEQVPLLIVKRNTEGPATVVSPAVDPTKIMLPERIEGKARVEITPVRCGVVYTISGKGQVKILFRSPSGRRQGLILMLEENVPRGQTPLPARRCRVLMANMEVAQKLLGNRTGAACCYVKGKRVRAFVVMEKSCWLYEEVNGEKGGTYCSEKGCLSVVARGGKAIWKWTEGIEAWKQLCPVKSSLSGAAFLFPLQDMDHSSYRKP